MDSLTEQSANTERPSTFKRERESSSSYDQGCAGNVVNCTVAREMKVGSRVRFVVTRFPHSNHVRSGVRGYSYYKESIIVYGGAPSAPPQVNLQSAVHVCPGPSPE